MWTVISISISSGLALEKYLNRDKKKPIDHIHIVFEPTPRNKLLSSLNDGLGDIIMANLTITDRRFKEVDFADPVYTNAEEVLVAAPDSPAVSSLENLAGKRVAVRASSSYYEHLLALNKVQTAKGKPDIGIDLMDENLEDEDLMEMVNAKLLPFIIVDDYKADI